MNLIQSSIVLHQLELYIHLGWPESERLQKQAVLVDIHMHFTIPPDACKTDALDERTNYDALNKKIIEETAPTSFRLIEHLGFHLYQITKAFLPENTYITIGVTKYPSISNLKGSVQFWYGDKLP